MFHVTRGPLSPFVPKSHLWRTAPESSTTTGRWYSISALPPRMNRSCHLSDSAYRRALLLGSAISAGPATTHAVYSVHFPFSRRFFVQPMGNLGSRVLRIVIVKHVQVCEVGCLCRHFHICFFR